MHKVRPSSFLGPSYKCTSMVTWKCQNVKKWLSPSLFYKSIFLLENMDDRFLFSLVVFFRPGGKEPRFEWAKQTKIFSRRSPPLSAEDDEEVMIRFVCLKSGRVFYSSGTIWPWSRFLAQFRIYVLPLIVVLTIRHLVLDVAWCFILKEATTLTKRISLSHSYNRHLVSLFRRQYKVHCVSVKNLS